MNYFNKNKKIILGVIIFIIIIGICYYFYTENNNFLSIQEQELEIDEQELDNSDVENKNSTNEISENKIIVHISGAVNKEGIIEVNENSRIADAVESAGGLREDACIDEVNLAYMLEDGMKIHIPTKEEQNQKNANIENKNNNDFYITNSSGINLNIKENENNSNKQESKSKINININKATQEELETLPGIGESTALKIINYREENGKFKKIEDIKEVSGIGESKFNKIKDMIEV